MVHRRKVQRLPGGLSALNDRLRASRTPPAQAEGEEIVHSRRKRWGRVNPLVVGSNPTGPTTFSWVYSNHMVYTSFRTTRATIVDVIWRQLWLHEAKVPRAARCLRVLACGGVNGRLRASGGGLRRKRTSGKGRSGQKRAYPRRAESGRPPIETRSVAREMLLGSTTAARSNGFDRGR